MALIPGYPPYHENMDWRGPIIVPLYYYQPSTEKINPIKVMKSTNENENKNTPMIVSSTIYKLHDNKSYVASNTYLKKE